MPNKNKNNTKHQFETIFLQADKLEVSYLESRNLQKVSKIYKLKMWTFRNQIDATVYDLYTRLAVPMCFTLCSETCCRWSKSRQMLK